MIQTQANNLSWGIQKHGGILHINEDISFSPALPLVIDVEDDEKGKFVGVGFTQDGKHVYYFTRVMLDARGFKLIGHNLKYDIRQGVSWGIKTSSMDLFYDTALASYVQNATKESHSLKTLAKEILGYEWPTYKEMVHPNGATKKKVTLDDQDVERVAAYNAMDVLATYHLWKHFDKTLTEKQKQLLDQIELPTARALLDMELAGVALDLGYLTELDIKFKEQLDKIEHDVTAQWNLLNTEPFNINSNKQVAQLLTQLGAKLPVSAKGNAQVNKQVLEQLGSIPLVASLKEHSKIEKLYSTYTQTLPTQQKNGRVHTTYNQISKNAQGVEYGIATGRLSSSKPNLQNIPTRTIEGAALRKCFVAKEGHSLIDADYCVTPETKILTTDLRWLPAGEVKVGDSLVSFSESCKDTRLNTTKVLKTKVIKKPCYRVTTDKGEVTCSADHMWVAKSRLSWPREWRQTKDFQKNDRIAFFTEPWEAESSWEAGYLAGQFDGEGCMRYQGPPVMTYTQRPGPDMERVKEFLKERRFKFGGIAKKGAFPGSGFVEQLWVCGVEQSLRLIGTLRPQRFLRNPNLKSLWEGRKTNGRTSIQSWAKVISVEYVGVREVVAIETDSHTFFAQGFYSHNCQIEYRLLAHFTGEFILLNAFYQDKDVHEETGKLLGADRMIGKTINFACVYGAQAKKIATTAKLTEQQAQKFLDTYWHRLPKVTAWIERVKWQAHKDKGVTTLSGRFLPLPDIDSKDKYAKLHAERAAVNYIIQGSAAEIMKLALCKLHSQNILPVLTIHDEFLFEVLDYEADITAGSHIIQQIMEQVVQLKIPLKVDVGFGKTWFETKQ